MATTTNSTNNIPSDFDGGGQAGQGLGCIGFREDGGMVNP
jgi:hypothetical protein